MLCFVIVWLMHSLCHSYNFLCFDFSVIISSCIGVDSCMILDYVSWFLYFERCPLVSFLNYLMSQQNSLYHVRLCQNLKKGKVHSHCFSVRRRTNRSIWAGFETRFHHEVVKHIPLDLGWWVEIYVSSLLLR